MITSMKVAVVHDWLPLIAGAERVLEQIVQVFPGADIYTVFDFLTEDQKKIFGNCKITASYLNRWPAVKKYYRMLLPFCPQAIESFDLSGYDLIISSSHAVAKGVITSAKQTHISYVHSPSRYAWDLMHQYLRESKMSKGIKGSLGQYLLHKFRIWDYRTANGVDHFIANSNYIKNRIWKVYRRKAAVIYPPVNIEFFEYSDQKEDFYLAASRMVPYKRIDLIAQAFVGMPNRKLKIIGTGPEMLKIKKIVEGSFNIEILGFQPSDVLKDYMQRAKAFVFAAEEDFGIISLEAQACGTPVIAYGAGGSLETVVDIHKQQYGASGLLFSEQSIESIQQAVKCFESVAELIPYANCRAHAESFAPDMFREKLQNLVEKKLAENMPQVMLSPTWMPAIEI